MSEVTPNTRTSRRIAGLSLIGFPALVIAANQLDHLQGSNAERVRAMAIHASEQQLASILMYWSALLTIVAVFAIGRLTLRATPKLARAAMTLGVIGASGHVVLATYGLVASFTGAGDRSHMAAFLDRVDDSAALIPLAIGIFLYGPALVLLVIALLRARAVGRVSLAAMVAALVLHMVPLPDAIGRLDLPNVLVLGVFGVLGVRILRARDEAFANGHLAVTDVEWPGSIEHGAGQLEAIT